MRRAFGLVGLATLPLLAAACDGAAHAHAAAPTETPVAVRVAPAEMAARGIGEEVVGTVRARDSAAIAATVMGKVRELRVTLGSRVTAGQVLVRLAAGEIDARRAQAGAVLEHARTEYARAERLQSQGAIPTVQFDAARSQLQVAQASAAEASAMADYTTLRAPFDGVVTAKLTNAGDTAIPGKPLLIVEGDGALRFEAPVPENASRALAVGRALPVRLDGAAAEVSGTVAEVSPSADPASRTVLVKLDLPRVAGVRAGVFGRVFVSSGEARSLLVPATALVRRGQLEEVFVVGGGAARMRLVRAGEERGGRIEIAAGLDAGERVIVSDTSRLRDGQPVEVRP